MVTENHYRWDFIGLSTDNKPTPATSEKVVDGSTFYCSDTSKLYVYCKDNWYERKALGGGGGTTYTAGDGITIADDTISVDTTTIQPKLTAGTGIDITDNTISATGGGSGGITELTSADYNYPTDNPTQLAVWLLDDGIYHSASTSLYLSLYSTPKSNGTFVKTTDSSNNPFIYYFNGNGDMQVYRMAANGTSLDDYTALKTSQVKQATGTSTTDVMSQNAVTSMVFADPANKSQVKIGDSSTFIDGAAGNGIVIGGGAKNYGDLGLALGYTSIVNYPRALAIGARTTANGNFSIALGTGATTSAQGELNIGTGTSYPTSGYNSTNYRLISGVHDPVNAHDAATKGYVDATAGVKTLTSDDYNFPSTDPSVIAPWLLPVGQYQIAPNTSVLPDGNASSFRETTSTMGLLILTQADSNGTYSSFIFSTTVQNHFYKVQYNGTPVTGFPHEL